jgi:hypothetical protein
MASAWRAAASGGAVLATLGITAAALPAAQAQAVPVTRTRTLSAADSGGAIPATLARAIHTRLGPGLVNAPSAWSDSSTPTATLSNQGKTAGTLGFSVALSQDNTTALVGAWSVGAAYVFHEAGGNWVTSSAPTATLTNAGLSTSQGFGWSVALSADGTTALIGDPSAGSNSAGAGYVYHVSSESSWTKMSSPTATLTNAAAGAGEANLGISVALAANGATALLGASAGEVSSSAPGAADVFHTTSEGTWASSTSPTATLTNAAGGNEQLGGAVALSADGTTALVGAQFAGPTIQHGNAYIYHAAAAGSWASTSTPTATLTNAGGSEEAIGSATALSADGTTALVGAFGAGAAYIYRATAENSWTSASTPGASLTDGGTSQSNGLGYSVALSADGTTAIAGAWFFNGTAGAAYVFQAASETAWVSTATPAATLTNAAGRKEGRFGYSVALSTDGSTALIGSPGQGNAFIYTASPSADHSSLSVTTSWRPQLSPPRTVVTFRAVGFPATQTSLAVRIYDRTTQQQLYFIRMTLSGGAGALWRTLPCGSYEVKYHHGDGQLGFRYFTVTNGGTCP